MLAHPGSSSALIVAAVGRNYLTAISTPFNFILFYEVLTLIAALPASTTRSIASQFEIVSLIFIRDVFHDIARASDLVTDHKLGWDTLPLFLDMWAGFFMYLLVAVFRHVGEQRAGASVTALPSRKRCALSAQKKMIAAGLAVLLVAMAAWNLGIFPTALAIRSSRVRWRWKARPPSITTSSR